MKYKSMIKRILLVLVFSTPLLVLGSVYDLDITYKLSGVRYEDGVYIYTTKPINMIIELLSEWPTAILFGALMYIIKENMILSIVEKQKTMLVNTVYAGLTIILGMREWESCFSDVLGDGKLQVVHYFVIFILTLISFMIALHFFKKIDKKLIRKYKNQAIMIACAGAIIFIIFGVLKVTWGRIRLQDLVTSGSLDGFTPWYKPNLFSGGMSFPSGHTAKASVLYLLIVFFEGDELRKKRIMTIIGVTGWLLLVCINRLFTASHYLTDITVGTGLAIVIVFVSLEIWNCKALPICK